MNFQQLKALLFWIGVFSVSLLVMVRPAAASGSVAAVSGGLQWQSNGQTYTRASTALASCNLLYNSMTPGLFNNLGLQFLNVDTTTGQNVYYCKIQTISNGYTNNYSDYPYNFPLTCPANAAGTSSCTCNTGYQPNAGATACVAVVTCPTSGTVGSSGFYDIGTDPNANNGSPPTMTCDSSCPSAYNGSSVGWRVLVSGVYHYYAQGSYVSTSSAAFPNCSSGVASPAPLSAVPTASCASGQNYGYVNGSLKCLNSDGSFAAADSASAVAAAKSLNDARIAKAIADAKAAAAAAGGSASDVAAAGTAAAGAASAGGGTSGTVPNLSPSDPMQSFCQQNPLSVICKSTSAQAGTGSALPSTGSGSWYVKTYPQGVGGVLTTNFNTMKNTPLAGLMTTLVPTFSGAAHSGCFSLSIWRMGTQQLCVPQIVMQALGVFMILTALFSARAIVFGG